MKNYENQTGKSKTGLSVSCREASISVSKKMYLFKDTFVFNDIIFYCSGQAKWEHYDPKKLNLA